MRFPPHPERRLAKGLALMAGVFLLVAISANSASTQPLERAGLVALAPSERLRLYTLARAVDTRHASLPQIRALRQALAAQAFYHEPSGPAVIYTDARLTPLLAWDANINGGFINDRFELFGLSVEVDQASMAKSGVVAGARLGADMRVAYGTGRFLEVQSTTEAVWSPRHEIGRVNSSLSMCARNHVTGWTFADLCAGRQAGWQTLSDSQSSSASATVSRLSTTGAAHHQLSFGVSRHWLEKGAQNAVTLGWGAVWNQMTTDVGLTLREAVVDQNALRSRISVQSSWYWNQSPVSLGVWRVQSDGGRFLGLERADRLKGINVSFRPRPGIALKLMHQQSRSTASLFNERRTGLSMQVDLGR